MIVYQAKFRREKIGSALAFFYCSFDQPQTLNVLTILGSFVKQIASHFEKLSKPMPPELSKKIKQVQDEDRDSFDLEELVDILVSFTTKSLETFFILDGLDECESSDRVEVLDFFRRLLDVRAARSSCKLLISSREDVNVSRSIPSCLQLPICATHTTADICGYVDSIVDDRIRTKELTVHDDSLVSEIKERLANGAQGMYVLN
jgi:hypothetical protein